MTAEEFRQQYCTRSKITLTFFDLHLVVLPCNCDAPNCLGWAAVSNDPEMQKHHMYLYGATEET